ncbi:integrase [Rhizobium sp. SG_E_25_P2]|uniref:site-specific integrase n=1 Tax=Rhizobium sp. SG_E_25_P2 TaxID=2879942 RepID=UPI002475FB8F|nr:site-specific integrase [Rhizobium sp. SG_E_25_P2]MDH6268259.1 integrase [Rhizobium sp. SG_E_25_P2]
MKKLGKNIHFYRGQWRARIVVPEELRAIIGKTQLEEPLGADPKIAEKRSHAVLAAFHDKLDLARAHLEASRPTVASAAKATFAAELEFDLMERAAGPRKTLRNQDRIYGDKLRLVAAGIITGEEAEALIGYAADDLIARGLADASTPTKRAKLLKVLASVRLDALAASQSRDKGEVYPPDARTPELLQPDPEPLPPIAQQPAKKQDGLTLAQLLTKFHGERQGGSDKTKKEHEVAIRMLSGFVGKDRSIRQITRADILAYKDALKLTPANSQQRFPGMTIVQAAKANAKRSEPYPVLNPATINGKWLMHLNNVFNWAVKNDLMSDNPAKGIKIDTGKGFKEPTRVPFSNDDLKAIFTNPFFKEAKTFEDRHWAILLALYTGARSSSEIRRVKLADIYEEQGILVIDLIEASKNVQSKRVVPVHKDLIDLGFVEHVEKLRKDGKTKLFPSWEPEGKINRWFLRTYKQECGINDSRKVFHSFRHSLKTALARYGVNRDVSDLITGHKDQSVGGIYISQQALTMVQAMSDGIDRVDFGVKGYLDRK